MGNRKYKKIEKNALSSLSYELLTFLCCFETIICNRLGWTRKHFRNVINDNNKLGQFETDILMNTFDEQWRLLSDRMNVFRPEHKMAVFFMEVRLNLNASADSLDTATKA